MQKRGQTSTEFMIFFGIAIAALIIYLLIANYYSESTHTKGDVLEAQSLVDYLKTEINLAASAEEGYSKEITLQEDINNKEYSIEIKRRSLAITLDDTDYTANLASDVDVKIDLKPGAIFRIIKKDEIVELSLPCGSDSDCPEDVVSKSCKANMGPPTYRIVDCEPAENKDCSNSSSLIYDIYDEIKEYYCSPSKICLPKPIETKYSTFCGTDYNSDYSCADSDTVKYIKHDRGCRYINWKAQCYDNPMGATSDCAIGKICEDGDCVTPPPPPPGTESKLECKYKYSVVKSSIFGCLRLCWGQYPDYDEETGCWGRGLLTYWRCTRYTWTGCSTSPTCPKDYNQINQVAC